MVKKTAAGLSSGGRTELLDFSVDALVFPGRTAETAVYTDGLTERQAQALRRLVDALRPES